MIAIIDYRMGNLQSVANAVELVGGKAIITQSRHEISEATHIILPGVGAFGEGIRNLKELNLVDFLKEQVMERNKPFLGICLGMQLMADSGTEFGQHEGFGWISGGVKRIEAGNFRLPHVGWNNISFPRESRLFQGVPANTDFYFVHSYFFDAKNQEDVIGLCEYAHPFAAAVNRGNIYGVQFHPEKSQKAGRAVLERFINL